MKKNRAHQFDLPPPTKNKFIKTLLSPLDGIFSKNKRPLTWVSPPKKRVLLTALLLVLMNAMDALITSYGVHEGWLQEINMVPKILLTLNLEVFVAVKVLGSAAAATMLYWRTVTNHRYAWYTLLGLTIIIGLLCAYMAGAIMYAHHAIAATVF